MNQIIVSSNIFNNVNTQAAWNDHYSEFELNTIYTLQSVTSRKVLENGNIYVHSYLFKDIISIEGPGGVFYLTDGTSNENFFLNLFLSSIVAQKAMLVVYTILIQDAYINMYQYRGMFAVIEWNVISH